MIEVVVFEASVVSLHNDVKGMLVPENSSSEWGLL